MTLSASERDAIMAEQRAVNAAAIRLCALENPSPLRDWSSSEYLAQIDAEIAQRTRDVEVALSELQVLAILLDAAGLSRIAQERAGEAISAIYYALTLDRIPDLGRMAA